MDVPVGNVQKFDAASLADPNTTLVTCTDKLILLAVVNKTLRVGGSLHDRSGQISLSRLIHLTVLFELRRHALLRFLCVMLSNTDGHHQV